jgi:hypothetical protein
MRRRSPTSRAATGSSAATCTARRTHRYGHQRHASRYEHRSVLITTNLAFAEWPKVFGGDEKLTAALLDRLAHHAAVITTRGKSFRMRKRIEPTEDASQKV